MIPMKDVLAGVRHSRFGQVPKVSRRTRAVIPGTSLFCCGRKEFTGGRGNCRRIAGAWLSFPVSAQFSIGILVSDVSASLTAHFGTGTTRIRLINIRIPAKITSSGISISTCNLPVCRSTDMQLAASRAGPTTMVSLSMPPTANVRSPIAARPRVHGQWMPGATFSAESSHPVPRVIKSPGRSSVFFSDVMGVFASSWSVDRVFIAGMGAHHIRKWARRLPGVVVFVRISRRNDSIDC